MFTLAPLPRRIVYVCTFEIIAIIMATLLLSLLSGGQAEESLPIAVAVSAIAVAWNYIFNTLFERWERRSGRHTRTVPIRIGHAVGFEGGLFLFTIPLYMLWYHVGVWEAIKMETALLIFFLVYTFFFTLLFDAIFTLPGARTASAHDSPATPAP